jgi:hypothetical protein
MVVYSNLNNYEVKKLSHGGKLCGMMAGYLSAWNRQEITLKFL